MRSQHFLYQCSYRFLQLLSHMWRYSWCRRKGHPLWGPRLWTPLPGGFDKAAIVVRDGGEIDCRNYNLTGTVNFGIYMMGAGSKVMNCNVHDFAQICIRTQGAAADTPHTILSSSVSGCSSYWGIYGEGAVSIASSSAAYNFVGISLLSRETKTLSNVVASNNFRNIELINFVLVNMTNVTACNAGLQDIYSDQATVTSSSLTCD